jgi:hypothetical protein
MRVCEEHGTKGINRMKGRQRDAEKEIDGMGLEWGETRRGWVVLQ